MELHQLKQQLSKAILQSFYVFIGEEVAVRDIYVNKIVELSKLNSTRVDGVHKIFSKLKNTSILNTLKCFIISGDTEYLQQEGVWYKLKEELAGSKHIIILLYSSIDKRSKFYKAHEDIIVEFEKLSPEILARYIQKEIGLSGKEAIQLANICGCDYNRILLECDKLAKLSQVQGRDIQSIFYEALQEKLIYIDPKEIIFELVGAICRRQIKKSFELWQEYQLTNDSPLGVISLLYTNLRQMLLVQSAGNTRDIENRTGLTSWQIKLARDKGSEYGIGQLVRALRLIRETEKNIKIGLISQDLAFDYILLSIL